MAGWRNVRIFLSSTFRDMHAERDYLIKSKPRGPAAEAGARHAAVVARAGRATRAPVYSLHQNLGTVFMRCQRHDEAVVGYRQALRHRPNYAATYLNLGYALKDSGRIQEATAAWEQAARLAPHDPALREERGRLRRPVMVGGGWRVAVVRCVTHVSEHLLPMSPVRILPKDEGDTPRLRAVTRKTPI
jgi:tetratricopeptide (TPR) repeat protein